MAPSDDQHFVLAIAAQINKKVLAVLGEGLKCILCIGELKEERESGETFNVCDVQLTEGLKGVSAEMMKDIVIAYEPVRAAAYPCLCRRMLAFACSHLSIIVDGLPFGRCGPSALG